jgi:starvation-inducible outer membrane lipoprotein
MKLFKATIIIPSLIFTLNAQSLEIIPSSTIEGAKVNVKGKVIQTVKHEGISCLFISSNKINKNGELIHWTHEKGGDVIACSNKLLDSRSLKNKFVSISAEFVSMNHDKSDSNLESYPVVKITNIDKLDMKHVSYVPMILPVGYTDPGYAVRSR